MFTSQTFRPACSIILEHQTGNTPKMISNLENYIVTWGHKPNERQMPQGNGKIEMKAKHLDLPESIKAAVVKKNEYPEWIPSVVKKGGYSVQSHPLRPNYI